jgi:glycosyltransferase involved in cell wall biosynthesis
MPEPTRRLLSVIHGPVFGGGFNQMVQLRGPFQDHGWETTAVATTEPGNAVERLRGAGVETVVMPLHRLRATPDPRVQGRFAASIWPEIRSLRRVIRERRIDLVQAHGDTNPHAAIAGHLEGVAVVWQLYDTRTPRALRHVTMPVVTRVADAITTWGEELARVHPGTMDLGERHVVVFPPVDADRFRPDPERRRSARSELGVSDDDFLIGAVGVRNPTKGYEWLARALARVRAERPEIQVRVLGSLSPVHAEYEQSVLDEIAVLGVGDIFEITDPGARVPELMPGFDALILSSVARSEGIPTVILEAMACGIPVISTEVGAVREVLTPDAGILIPPEEIEPMARAMGRLAGDRDQAAALGGRGRELVEERYRLEICADRHLRAYELALEHRRLRRNSH